MPEETGDEATAPGGGSTDQPEQPDVVLPPRADASAADRESWNPTGLDLARAVTGEIAARAHAGGRRPRRRRRGSFDGTSDADRSGGYSGPAPDDRDPQDMQSTLDRLVADRGWGTDLAVAGAVARWPQVVGEKVAAHAVAEEFDDGVLTVRADSSSWATQVKWLAPDILKALAKELGDQRVIRIVVRGPNAPTWKHGQRAVRGRGPRDTYG